MKLRSLDIPNYLVLQARQRIGRCFAKKRMPGDWFPDVTSYLAGGVGSSKDNAGRAEFKAAWEALKARTPPPPKQPEDAHKGNEHSGRGLISRAGPAEMADGEWTRNSCRSNVRAGNL